jgi:Pilus formation protein N terminal region
MEFLQMVTFRAARFALALAASLGALPGLAAAGTNVTVPVDNAKVLSIAGTPSAIIVGNPLYADVSVQNGKVVVFGKNYGATNVIVMDGDGNQLAAFDITVTSRSGSDGNLTIYKGSARTSAVCAPNCEPTLQAGDSSEFVKSLNDAMTTKSGQSTQAAGSGGGAP